MTWPKILISVMLTLLLMLFAFRFGPNYKYTVEKEIHGLRIWHKAPRTSVGKKPAVLELHMSGDTSPVSSVILCGWQRNRPSQLEELAPTQINRVDHQSAVEQIYTFQVPSLPWAARYNYFFKIRLNNTPEVELKKDGTPMVIRFRDDVPNFLLFLHISAMFAAFFMVMMAGLMAIDLIRKGEGSKLVTRWGWWGWFGLALGGLPLGFLMNWFAFRVIWEAWPFGQDITDNKTQLALLFYGAALLTFGLILKHLNKVNVPPEEDESGRTKARLVLARAGWIVLVGVAAVFAVYLIPHSI